MTNQITTNNPHLWLQYFNKDRAVRAFVAHVANLPSSKTTKHTARAYEQGLRYFLEWSQDHLPTPELVEQYGAHLKHQKNGGLKSSTIASKYLAPLRLYLNKLASQPLPGFTGSERDYIADCREYIRAAADVKNPAPDTTTNRPALYAHGDRLTLGEVNRILDCIDYTTIEGKRDFALLYLGFTSGLRLAELARLTQNKIKRGESTWEAHVIGKRNNIDPVPLDENAVTYIEAYVEAYNLSAPDDGKITRDSPLWQPLHNSGSIFTNNDTSTGLTAGSIQSLVKRRSRQAINREITPHDMRRTVAAIARAEGMDYDDIRALLRHKSIATTARYVGKPQNMSASLISTRVNFVRPAELKELKAS